MTRSKRRNHSSSSIRLLVLALTLALLSACGGAGGGVKFRNPDMDFGSLQTVAIMPLNNLTRDGQAADRVRDVYISSLLASGAMYVIPPGEVLRGIIGAGIERPTSPTPEEVVKFCKQLKVDGVITGSLREYGELRSGSASANVISLSAQLFEGQTGKVVWSASSTKGGITIYDRLFGGGGESMNAVTEQAVNDLINKLFK
jgi:polysaccharide biosynthesis protein PelC